MCVWVLQRGHSGDGSNLVYSCTLSLPLHASMVSSKPSAFFSPHYSSMHFHSPSILSTELVSLYIGYWTLNNYYLFIIIISIPFILIARQSDLPSHQGLLHIILHCIQHSNTNQFNRIYSTFKKRKFIHISETMSRILPEVIIL